jgi:hypothetical protein
MILSRVLIEFFLKVILCKNEIKNKTPIKILEHM